MTESALLQRVRRALAKDGLRLRTTGGNDLGNYLIDERNNVVAYHCDIDRLAAEMEVNR